MKTSEVAASLAVLIQAGESAHLSGEPGVGKTSIVAQTAKALKMDLLTTRLALEESVDLRGIPVPDLKAKTTTWLTPEHFPREGCKPMIWFFDEWMQGHPSVQAIAGQLLNERRLGDYRLPKNVYICGASNRAKDRSATNRMPAHVADRFTHLSVEADVGDWSSWAVGAQVATEVIGFVRWRPKLLQAFDPNADVSPTCRSWESISNVLGTLRKPKVAKLEPGTEQQMYAGKVGEGAASEFFGFLQIFRTLPDPQHLLMNPDKCELPTEPATLCALAAVLARKATETNFDRVVKIANRLADEYSVLTIMQATLNNPALSSTRAFIDWSIKHADALA